MTGIEHIACNETFLNNLGDILQMIGCGCIIFAILLGLFIVYNIVKASSLKEPALGYDPIDMKNSYITYHLLLDYFHVNSAGSLLEEIKNLESRAKGKTV